MSTQLSTCATEVSDTDYDVFPSLANGANFDVIQNTSGGAHTICNQCLMTPAIPRERRRLPSATDVLALATCPNPGWSRIDLPRQEFLPGGTNDWNTARNWVGDQLPGSADDATCRHGVEFGSRTVSLSANAVAANLLLSSSTNIRTNAHKLDIVDSVTIEFDGTSPIPQIFVEDNGELEASRLVINGGELDMTGGYADINGDIRVEDDSSGRLGSISGYGIVDVSSRLTNNGSISATDGVTRTLSLISASASPWDLDGSTGSGEISALTGNLNFSNGGLTDSFDGAARVAAPYTLRIGADWTLGAGGLVELRGGNADPARLAGGTITAASGTISCELSGLISAPVDFGGSLFVFVDLDSQLRFEFFTLLTGGTYQLFGNSVLELDGDTNIAGGAFDIRSGSTLRADGVTTIGGGTFDIASGATVNLAGSHTLTGGTFTGDGSLRFNGTTTTIGEPVTIDCARLDLDGPGSIGKRVNINADLTINSTSLEATGNNSTFNSTLNFGPNNGFNSHELRVLEPESWQMAGTMNVNSGSTLTLPSVSGSPFTMSGDTNVNDSTRWDAVASISGTVRIPSADDTFSLNAGSAAEPNRLLNGLISGPGRFRATGTSNLVGHGIIDAPIDFLGSDSPGGSETRLLASGGTLLISDPFVNVPEIIGTADETGILRVTMPWTVTTNDTLLLQGGLVTGAPLTNEGIISGFGTLGPDELNNNGEIAATGGNRLVIDTTSPCNLDGLDVSPTLAQHRVDASAGQITINGPLLDPFDGTVIIGAGHDLTIPSPWELGINGTLQMDGGGDPGSPATLLGNGLQVRGTLEADGECVLETSATFFPSSTTTLNDASTTLRLLAGGAVTSGAAITGAGQLVAMPGSTIGLTDSASVGVPVVNEGTLIGISSPAQSSVAGYTQTSNGRLAFVLEGRPATGDFDALTVSGQVSLDGRLSILFQVPDAQVGDTWKIVETPSLSGAFTIYDVTGLPAGLELVKREESDGVYLDLVAEPDGSFLDWAENAGIPEELRTVDGDGDGDSLGNGLELFLGGDPNSADPGLLPVAERREVDGTDYLSLTVVLANTFNPSDLTFRVTRSTDGTDWSASNVVIESSSTDPGSGAETRVYRSTLPYSAPEREFLRAEAGP